MRALEQRCSKNLQQSMSTGRTQVTVCVPIDRLLLYSEGSKNGDSQRDSRDVCMFL